LTAANYYKESISKGPFEYIDQERRQELHDAAKAARESLDALTHLIEIAEGTL